MLMLGFANAMHVCLVSQLYEDACLVGSDSQEVALAGIDGITTLVSKHDTNIMQKTGQPWCIYLLKISSLR